MTEEEEDFIVMLHVRKLQLQRQIAAIDVLLDIGPVNAPTVPQEGAK